MVPAYAEVVQLKDGKTLTGKIIKEDNEATWLEINFLNGKLVRKIEKSEIASTEAIKSERISALNLTEVNRLSRSLKDEPQNISETQKVYFAQNKIIEIPKKWKFVMPFEFAKIYGIEADDNPYGKYELLITFGTTYLAGPISLDKFFEDQFLGQERSNKKIEKRGYSVINGVKMQWLKIQNKGNISFRYTTWKNDQYYIFEIAADKITPSFPDTYDAIISKIKF